MPKLVGLSAEELLERKREKQRAATQRWRERHPERSRALVAARRDKWVQENPMGWRNAQWKYYYGMEPGTYQKMFEQQGGKCAVCGNPPQEGKLLNVDHCHTSGAIRGLLCRDCNLGLGHFKDAPERLEAAIAYLAHQKEKAHA